jgi:hypothetical protein
MENSRSRLRKVILLVSGLTIILLLLIVGLKVKSKNDLISELRARLVQSGVPVRSITVDSRIPFQITIILQSTGAGDRRTEDDVWNEHLAIRESSLAHKFGLNLDGFTLVLINQQGETIDWSQIGPGSLNPQSLAYRQFSSGTKELDNQATEALLREQLDFRGMAVDELTVTTGVGSELDVQSVSIRLSTLNLQTANPAIPAIIGSLKNGLNKVNQESDYSQVAICRLWILDSSGNILLSYNYDLELGSEWWGMAPGITQDWFPHPIETPAKTSTPHSYPTPQVTIIPTAPSTSYP